MNEHLKPFKIDVREETLEDLRDRLARTRWPDEVNDENWSYGTDLSYLKELCGYWKDKYDWRAREAELNRFPQFTTEIDGLNIHFIIVCHYSIPLRLRICSCKGGSRSADKDHGH